MARLVVDEKALRKYMIDRDIKTINDLSNQAGVSKPTIYDFLNGKSPFTTPFLRICESLGVSPTELLTELKEEGDDADV